MKPIKKFLMISDETSRIMESLKEAHGPALLDIVKKLGYNSLEEISKQKSILTKLESLLKEIPSAKEVSEDEADDIEDEVVKRGEPKDASGLAGEKEEDKEPGASNKVVEDDAEEIEADILKMGKPKSLEDKEGEEEEDGKVGASNDKVAEEEIKGEEKETPKATRKIMTFEDFVNNEEKSKSKNENAIVEDEEVGPDGLAIPVETGDGSKTAEDIEKNIVQLGEPDKLKDEEGKELVTTGQPITTTVKGQGSIIKSFAAFIKEAEEVGPGGLSIPLVTGDGSKTAEDIEKNIVQLGKPNKLKDEEGEELVTKGQDITEEPKTSKDKPANVVVEGKVNEGDKVSSDAEFKEYATVVLKKAFGDKFDEAEANKVIDGLTKKYEGDYGAMVGALTNSLGESNEVNETAKRTKFTGKTAHDLYTQIDGKPTMVFVKNDWYSVDPSELKDDKGEWFTGYTKDGSDYEFHVKDIGFIQESVNEATEVLDCLMIEIDADYENDNGRDVHKDFKIMVKCKDADEAKHLHDVITNEINHGKGDIDTGDIASDIVNSPVDSSVLGSCILTKYKKLKYEWSSADLISALEDNNKDLVKNLRK
jgi:hypothetical protein